MARRISAFFSSKDLKDEDLPQSSNSSQFNNSLSGSHTPPRGKLTKPMTKSPSDINLHPPLDFDFAPPPSFGDVGNSSRPVSRDGRIPLREGTSSSRNSSSSRPQTPTMLSVPGTASPLGDGSPAARKLNKRRSFIPTKSDRRSTGAEPDQIGAQAWIAGLKELYPYDIGPLLNGQQVSDLWSEDADVLVYLFPESSRKGPSFKVHSQLFADSRVLSYLTQPLQTNNYLHAPTVNSNPIDSMADLSLEDQYIRSMHHPYGLNGNGNNTHDYDMAASVKTLYLPLSLDHDYSAPGSVPRGDDMELLVLYRNFFAFLCGGALVATHRQNSLYSIFMSISSILSRLQYGNEKGSSWGAIPWQSFLRYTEELRLDDLRASREKNIEAILIGVAMRSWPLYAEGFVHAVGRLEDIKSINSPKFEKIPPAILNKLERASHDLQAQRLQPLHAKLDNFYFPSMFAGVANSQTATEAKLVRFKTWKAYFMDFRQYTISQYKRRYGNWPPKASSKKNNFEESGLNRLLLREVYQDFTDLYDMLADRTSLTPRIMVDSTLADDAESGSNESIQHALRAVESEYDRSTPPVTPPIPFDVPIIPAYERHMLAKDSQNARKLKDVELNDLLSRSYNRDGVKHTPWLQDFIEYERKLCHGKTIQDLADVRCGQWLFMYAVLQALPMTVVDARDLTYTEGVEYFLCVAPRGGRPWVQDDVSTSRAWFNVASGGGLVSMPADVIDHSVEGNYRRSHCWTVATTWAQALGPMSPISPNPRTSADHAFSFSLPHIETSDSSFLEQPQIPAARSPYLAPAPRSVVPSPYQSPLLQPVMPATDGSGALPRISSRSSMNMGLQEVAAPIKPHRPVSSYNPNITFDNIIASQQIQQKTKKKPEKAEKKAKK